MIQVPPKLFWASRITKLIRRALGLEVIGGADAGDSGADDRHIEMLGRLGFESAAGAICVIVSSPRGLRPHGLHPPDVSGE